MDLTKFVEVKIIHIPVGYQMETEKSTPEDELNKFLSEGWKIIAILTDVKFSLEFRNSFTNHYAVIGN